MAAVEEFLRRVIGSQARWDWLRSGRLLAGSWLRWPHDPEFHVFARWAHEDGLFVDVGANGGLAAMSFAVSNRRSPILSFEANATLEPSLARAQRVLGKRYRYELRALGAERGELTFHVPMRGTLPITTRASLLPEAPEAYAAALRARGIRARVESFVVEVVPMDELALEPRFVKIDVEGAEYDVLRGMRSTLERYHPILFIERGSGLDAARTLLAEQGYALYGFTVQTGLLPEELAPPTTNLLALAGPDRPVGR